MEYTQEVSAIIDSSIPPTIASSSSGHGPQVQSENDNDTVVETSREKRTLKDDEDAPYDSKDDFTPSTSSTKQPPTKKIKQSPVQKPTINEEVPTIVAPVGELERLPMPGPSPDEAKRSCNNMKEVLAEISRCEGSNARKQAKIAGLQAKIARMQAELVREKAEIEEMQAKHVMLIAKIEIEQSELARLKVRMEGMQAKLVSVKENVISVQANLNKTEREFRMKYGKFKKESSSISSYMNENGLNNVNISKDHLGELEELGITGPSLTYQVIADDAEGTCKDIRVLLEQNARHVEGNARWLAEIERQQAKLATQIAKIESDQAELSMLTANHERGQAELAMVIAKNEREQAELASKQADLNEKEC